MATTDKDTIYVDIDDEITGIIDKVRSSQGKVVALVLPKRASVFQSIVNMKLLKRAADNDTKHLVLITSEAGLLPLAGAAGVHVANTLTSKPSIPLGPGIIEDDDEAIQEDGEPVEPKLDPKQPVGKLAAATAIDANGVETLIMDDEDVPPEAQSDAVTPKTFEPPKDSKKKLKKDKKLQVPNFERFRLLLVLFAVVIMFIIGGFIYANYSLAKATITVKTDAKNVDANFDLNVSTAATAVVPSNNTVPAKLSTQQKTYSQQVPTTGQKNNGNKASGSISVNNCSKTEGDITIPAGTGFSSNGNTYISQQSVTVPESSFTGGDKCKNTSKASVDVIAQSPGTAFNLPAGSSFNIALGNSGLTGTGGTLSGGTDSIVQSVNQNDINNAKAKISAANDAAEKAALKSDLQQAQYYAIEATYQAGTPAVTSSANVGQVADNVTVTETVTYTMFGVHESDLSGLIDVAVKTQIDSGKQIILDNGLNKANFNVNNISPTIAQVSFSTKATVGPDINADTIKQNAAGQKPMAIKSDLTSNPDVTDVTVKLSPFWVSTVPKKSERITVNIAKPASDAKASSDSGDNP